MIVFGDTVTGARVDERPHLTMFYVSLLSLTAPNPWLIMEIHADNLGIQFDGSGANFFYYF